jgi:hypothetical protein
MPETARDTRAPADWSDILAESEAELEAGQTVSGESLLRELREAAERLEAGRPRPPKAARHR